MKRYLLFTFDSYYPEGGWHDLKGTFDTRLEALDKLRELQPDNWQIVDSANGDMDAGHNNLYRNQS